MNVLIVHLSLNIFRALNEDEMGLTYEKDQGTSKEQSVGELQTQISDQDSDGCWKCGLYLAC